MQVIVEMLPKFQSTHYELTEVVTGLVPKSVGEMHMKEEDAADLSSELCCCSSLNSLRTLGLRDISESESSQTFFFIIINIDIYH